MSWVVSSGPTCRSASSSFSSNGIGSVGRPKVVQNQPYSTAARCFTRPSRLVPEGLIGRRRSASPRPSIFQTTASRCRSRLACRLSFSAPVKGTRRLMVMLCVNWARGLLYGQLPDRASRPGRVGQSLVGSDQFSAEPFRKCHVPRVVYRQVRPQLPDATAEGLKGELQRPGAAQLLDRRGGANRTELTAKHEHAQCRRYLCAKYGGYLEDGDAAQVRPGQIAMGPDANQRVDEYGCIGNAHPMRGQCESRSALTTSAEQTRENPSGPSLRSRSATSLTRSAGVRSAAVRTSSARTYSCRLMPAAAARL